MSKEVLVYLYLICGCHAGSDPRKNLATYLLASKPSLINRRSIPAMPARQVRIPSMNVMAIYMDLAETCLEDGCPTEGVSNLVAQLKAVENPTAEVVTAIRDLEELLVEDKPDKNAMASVLEGILQSFAVIDKKAPIGYSTKPGKGTSYIPAATIDLANSCLEAGCPVDMVTELLTSLKAMENPSPEALKTIEELEALLAQEKPNKNALDKVVGGMVRTFPAENLIEAFDVASTKEPLSYSKKPSKTGADALTTNLFAKSPTRPARPTSLARRVHAPSMNGVDLAASCLEDGCPLDEVSQLVADLEAVKDPTPEVVEAIKELTQILPSGRPNKNAMANVPEGMVQSGTVIDKKTQKARERALERKATIDAASDCLKGGCPVDLVLELTAKLKAEKNQSKRSQKIIKRLERFSSNYMQLSKLMRRVGHKAPATKRRRYDIR